MTRIDEEDIEASRFVGEYRITVYDDGSFDASGNFLRSVTSSPVESESSSTSRATSAQDRILQPIHGPRADRKWS